MKLKLHTYSIFLMLIGIMAMVAFWKINKYNFYTHYFKVIEEVEVRNSQGGLLPAAIHIESLEGVFQNIFQWLAFVFSVNGLIFLLGQIRLQLFPPLRPHIVARPLWLHLYPNRGP